ncbi:hypothetical protein G6F57_021933 [Rhizopus arrhizus]|nr:hypothetical protein G6F57_021933 [Rhizopus arrhizus]
MTQQAFGIGDLGPVQLALRGVRTHLGFGGIQLRARHGFLARQAPVALQIGLGVVQQRLGARQFSLGGGQRGQVGPGVDLGQQLAPRDGLAFGSPAPAA